MEIEYISKKDLLEVMDISYGQLYRWKRKEIIPENWFIKKSSFTGQETFFPKKKVIERIEKIKELKDSHSLDELAEFFSTNPKDVTLSIEEIINLNIIKKETWEKGKQFINQDDSLDFKSILFLKILEKINYKWNIELDEMTHLFQAIRANQNFFETNFELAALEKGNTIIWLFIPIQSEWQFDAGAKKILSIDLKECVNDLNISLSAINK
ncbi:DUF4004 family protein [Metabacillus arenae]|uniref:DUF4004 family protein n=1 Tax=Metabacillus arenae TaxID=2771434 RepID=A0A926NFG6_9BACI|nr:DUF4004 family protein [Metabacillus arenae]MBD1379528.1 DUF4004 family protein [Metabacillus arenae]